MRWFLLPVLLLFAACDTGAPLTETAQPSAAQLSSTTKAFVAEADVPYAIADNIMLHTKGDHLVLEVNGEAITLTAGQAYLAGQALSRGGYELMDPELAAGVVKPRRPGTGPTCNQPLEGSLGILVGGWIFAGGDCPPPPPPDFMEFDLLRGLLSDAPAEIVELPSGLDWLDMPGGFGAPLR